MSEQGVATREYIDFSQSHIGSTTDANEGIEYYFPWNVGIIGVDTILGKPSKNTIILEGRDFETKSYPVFIRGINGSKVLSDLVSSAREFIESHVVDHLAEPSLNFLHTLENNGVLLGLEDLPPFGISIDGEESLLVQWTFPYCRIGIVFEKTLNQSSWYILSDEKSDGMTAWGFLHKIGNPKLVNLIINQISN